MSNSVLFRHEQTCKEPVRRSTPYAYSHRGYSITKAPTGWQVRDSAGLQNEYRTLADALHGIDQRPPTRHPMPEEQRQ
jgi:hypothetical protein